MGTSARIKQILSRLLLPFALDQLKAFFFSCYVDNIRAKVRHSVEAVFYWHRDLHALQDKKNCLHSVRKYIFWFVLNFIGIFLLVHNRMILIDSLFIMNKGSFFILKWSRSSTFFVVVFYNAGKHLCLSVCIYIYYTHYENTGHSFKGSTCHTRIRK